ncbi:MAG: PLP-dependent aminotransferase family protein [Anaerolineales bacterium]|jgi:GntR family transcriptional regulator/MocR family aminotransferase|nr:PLP-dependent aminotransferase family protein [Anaerolineales bacterium]
MRILLDRKSPRPLYEQIKSHLRQGILSGSLAPATRLPASRQLAQSLGVNRITVENAYSALAADGLVFSRVGSGTYVLPPIALPKISKINEAAPWPLWQQNLPERSLGARAAVEEMRLAASHPDPLSFAGGISDSHLFPADDFRKVLQTVMRRDGIEALSYGDRRGFAPLRETIAHILGSQGLQTSPENVLITAGSQQALALVSQLLLEPGDTILVESPTYSGALDLFRALNFKIISVPVDGQGMQVDLLEKQLQQHHPKILYTIPNFHNPTGTCLSAARRQELIVLSERYNVPILEDDFVGDLRYEGRAQPALKALDPGGRVIYVSTFSKMLMPGLRVGFLVADGPVYDGLVKYKRVNDLATSGLIQRALQDYVTVGRYQAHLRRSSQIFHKRRDAMLAAIRRHLPAGVKLDPPQGGLFLWMKLPHNLSADVLLPLAISEGVDFMPGSGFFLEEADGLNWLRLNFVVHNEQRIEEGVRRLGEAMDNLQK